MTEAEARKRLWAPDSAAVLIWLLLGVAAGLFSWRATDYAPGLVATSALALAFGIWVFWRHGGPQITAASVYSLASAAFVGFAGLWWAEREGSSVDGALLAAALVAFFAHVLMYGLFWQHGRDRLVEQQMPPASREASRWARNTGLVLTAGSAAITLATPAFNVVTDVGIFVGVTLFAVGMLTSPERRRLDLWQLLGLAAAFAVYYGLTFNGFGRLTLVSLAVGLAVLACTRLSGRRFKVLVLAAAPVAVYLLGQTRVDLSERLTGGPGGNEGLGSVVSPLETFARLLRAPSLDLSYGETFLSSITVLVPRAVWPGKPVGLGAELTRILEPQMAGTGHSMAGLSLSEWWISWGVVGLVVMVPVVGLLIIALDRLLVAAWSMPAATRSRILLLVAAALAIGGLADFVWVGSFTYMTRAGFRLLAVAAMFVVFAWRTERAKPDPSPWPKAWGRNVKIPERS